jgi:hypothetical protein
MAMVLIRCSETNLPVTTGLFMDRSSFESATFRDEDTRLRCPLCRQIHVWRKEEAYLVEENEPITGA